MTRVEILERIAVVFADTMDSEDITIQESTEAKDVEKWDSLMHVLLVDAIENEFEIRFKASEIQEWENIGQIIDSIELLCSSS